MITSDQAQQLVSSGGRIIGTDDEKIGDIGQIFLDDRTDEPEWVTAKTGWFGGGQSFVPLQDARIDGNDVRVPYDRATVKDAPRISDTDDHLSEADEDRLFTHYGVGTTTPEASTDPDKATYETGLPATGDRGGEHAVGDVLDRDRSEGTDASGRAAGAGHDTSGPDTDSAMTRSEEQLRVGTETRTTGRARLRKYIVTENVTTTVPVSHEEVRIEREPITDANIGDATSGGELTSEEHEVVLHEERPVVEKETVPVERVRVDVDTVRGEEQVDEEVRKEQIEFDDSNSDVDSERSRRPETDLGGR